jgi:hypothetical protein
VRIGGGNISRNNFYDMKELNCGIDVNVKQFNCNMGVKVFNLNRTENQVGYQLGITYNHVKIGQFSLHGSKAYLPSTSNSIVPYVNGNISYTKKIF